jgi:predicted nucleotidyltransferase
MNNNLTVLKFFVENKDAAYSIKKVSELLKINYRIVYEEIMDLAREELIQVTKQGNAQICKFNYAYNAKLVEIEQVRMQEVFRNTDIKLICHRMRNVKNPFYCLILFGSFANKKNKKESDIDLCLITDNDTIKNQVNDMVSITPIDIHLQVFTAEQFLQMHRSKESNVGNEIVKNNIILHGIEEFYELVNNVNK